MKLHQKLTCKQIADLFSKQAELFPDTELTPINAAVALLELFGSKNVDDSTDNYGQRVIYTGLIDGENGFRNTRDSDFN